MCGIFGFSGKKGKSINLHKLTILGLYNEKRGTDSTGYYFNGNIERGIGVDSDFSIFVANRKLIPGDLKTKVFMGHTRKGTIGGSTLENAHPHVVSDDYVQTHNGTLSNAWTLCNKYKVDHLKLHVDSMGLAHLIAKLGPKMPLEEYVGSAALAFTYKSRPEALFLYHGASKESKAGELVPERPLFILHQPEGVYYSSIKESLEAISSDENKPFILKHNVVFEVVGGEFTGNSITIDRENNNIPVYVNSKAPMTPHQPYLLNTTKEPVNENDLILGEEFPSPIESNKIYYQRGRYYVGVRQTFHTTTSNYPSLMTGEYYISRGGYVVPQASIVDPRVSIYYFLNGIMLTSELAYKDCLSRNVRGFTPATFLELSTFSRYPIIAIKDSPTSASFANNLWHHSGRKVRKHTFNPKFANRRYKIKFGQTKQITPLCTEFVYCPDTPVTKS